jgi:hypothetical protein
MIFQVLQKGNLSQCSRRHSLLRIFELYLFDRHIFFIVEEYLIYLAEGTLSNDREVSILVVIHGIKNYKIWNRKQKTSIIIIIYGLNNKLDV